MTGRRGLLAGCVAAVAAGSPVAATEPACPAVAVPPIPAPRLAEAIRRERPVRIVAFGSSSTAGAGASAPWMAYPARLESRLRAALPRLGVTVLNRGVGGEDADAMLLRLERDVIAADPDLVVWQVGANAALRSMDKADFDRFLRAGLARLRAARIDVVLMDNQRAPRIAARPGHRDYDAMLSAAAAAVPGVALFSRGALMDAWAAAGLPPGAALVEDGLHHNDLGYRCLADALAGALLAGAAAGQGVAAR
jgi:lysophospholipase L1-like esterase